MQYPQDIYLRVTFHIITSMDKYENRRLQLEALVASIGHGGIKQVAEKIGKEPSYVSRMLYRPGKPGGKRIGEDTQEALQAAFSDWYQQPKRPTSQPSTQDQPSASLTPSSELPTDALVEAIAKAMSQIPSDLVPAAAKVVESLASSPNSEMLKNHLGQMISSGRVDAKR